MRMEDGLGLTAGVVLVAMLVYLATCASARAEPTMVEHTIRYRNADATRALSSLQTAWGAVPVNCPPGATCAVVVRMPWGQHTGVTIRGVSGPLISAQSNAIDFVAYPSDAERADFDGSRSVTVLDFAKFLRVLGSSW
jgi:hypothetical protein